MEDIEAIKKVKAKYGYYADALIAGDASKGDDFVSLYTEDANIDITPVGKTEPIFETKA